jgi:hypothetical protein
MVTWSGIGELLGDLFVGFLVCAAEAGAVGQAGGGVVADRFHERAASYPDVTVSGLDLSGQLFSGSFHAACCRFRYSL